MAARRLIIVLIVLLVASVVAATIAPDRTGRIVGVDTNSSTTTSESTTETTTAPAPQVPDPVTGEAGDDFVAPLVASVQKPDTVRGFVGDQLTLEVSSDPPRSIEIEAFGLTDYAAPGSPAIFDLLLQEPGRFPIADGESGQTVGRLIVKERSAKG